jgi:hypothetical protein
MARSKGQGTFRSRGALRQSCYIVFGRNGLPFEGMDTLSSDQRCCIRDCGAVFSARLPGDERFNAYLALRCPLSDVADFARISATVRSYGFPASCGPYWGHEGKGTAPHDKGIGTGAGEDSRARKGAAIQRERVKLAVSQEKLIPERLLYDLFGTGFRLASLPDCPRDDGKASLPSWWNYDVGEWSRMAKDWIGFPQLYYFVCLEFIRCQGEDVSTEEANLWTMRMEKLDQWLRNNRLVKVRLPNTIPSKRTGPAGALPSVEYRHEPNQGLTNGLPYRV